MAEYKITKENFEELVVKADKPVLLDFWATWCGPCRMLAPIVAQLAQEHPEIRVGKVNVDEEAELANLFRVSSIPMIALIKNGKLVDTAIGYRPKEELEALLRAD